MRKRVNEPISVKPFIKWAGGKRWFTNRYPQLFPQDFDCYFEPFLGGGASYFHLLPNKAVLSDSNKELICTYSAIRDSWKDVLELLKVHQTKHSDDYFYQVRGLNPKSQIEIAARTLYLNRTCWNGLYRVNLKGAFNVPRGTKDSVIFQNEDFKSYSEALGGAEIIASDFEPIISRAGLNDFVFVDPPYTVSHNNNGFIKYNEKLFSWDCQIRLADSVRVATAKGAKVMILNANHGPIRDLYSGFEIKELQRRSTIAASSSFRGSTSEICVLAGF